MNQYFGIKTSMTQLWDDQGKRHPVTVVATTPLTVTQVKTTETDGYNAVQVGVGSKPIKSVKNPLRGHLKLTKEATAPKYLRELKITTTPEYTVGQNISVGDVFTPGDLVDVIGVSKGHGFTGVMTRWGFKGGPKTHGQSDRARAPGSIGQGTSPGRVHKGKKMAGHMGVQQFTIKNLTVLKVDTQDNLLWLSGPVPGAFQSLISIIKTGTDKRFAGVSLPLEEKEAEEIKEEVKAEIVEEVKAE